ncbi:shieldin complex subunit 2 isoform X2 [Ornithorhynchus anatinus]|nr:shieldin complex subunit 2 isoform X2 [Ornithorhynchus anatinus]XP_039767468.1 shieldin complex subunit 2 isoform X2 [Ornithorhynchus anatinus]
MTKKRQIHIFFGAPLIPPDEKVSQEPNPSQATASPWKTIPFLSDGYSLKLATENEQSSPPEDLPGLGPAELSKDSSSVNSGEGQWRHSEKYATCVPETQNIESQNSTNPVTADTTDCIDKMSRIGTLVRPSVERDGRHLFIASKKTAGQQQGGKPNAYPPKSPVEDAQQENPNHTDIASLVSTTKQFNIHPKTAEANVMPSDHRETLSHCLRLFFPETIDEPKSKTPKNDSNLEVSTDIEFLSINTSSQIAFLAQRQLEDQCENKETTNTKGTDSGVSWKEMKGVENHLVHPSDDFAEGNVVEQSQANSLELFSPVKADDLTLPSKERSEDCGGSSKLFSTPEKQSSNEIYIESCSSGILCSQLNTFHRDSVKRPRSSEGILGHCNPTSKESKRARLICSPTGLTSKVGRKEVCELGMLQKKSSLLKNCVHKSQKYNCLVTVFHPCHVKEIQVKAGPNSGSKVPVATIVVLDQSEIKMKVVLWRAAAFWALTVFPGDIILLTDVTVYEDQWLGETVLQSTFSSQLLNLGSCSSIQPSECSNVVDVTVLRDLLKYMSSKHSYLISLPKRQPQKLGSIQYLELDQLQPDTLIHSVLKILSITVLTEAIYSYRGQKQRKIVLTVAQVEGQHRMLILWGSGTAWYPQLQKKRDHIWEFKYLLAQCNSISGELELHTTPWSSCECLFDDDKRAVEFKAKFQKNEKNIVKISDISTHLEEKRSGVVRVKAQILELAFPVASAQNRQIVFSAHSSLESILASFPQITYSGCGKCGLELKTDENKIYKQCFRCLPFTMVKTFYRPALMTVVDGQCKISIHVGSALMEKILLNIPPDWLKRVIVPSSDITYAMVAADLCHSLLAAGETAHVLEIRSIFFLDENSYPLQQDFHLQDFHPDL